MRAWIQSVPPSVHSYLSFEQTAHWFGLRGYEILRFDYEDLQAGKIDEDLLGSPDEMVIRGGVETVHTALTRAKRPLPPNLDLPDSLRPWIGRKIWRTSLGEVRASVDRSDFQALHVKPLNQHKLFTGYVIEAFRDLIPTASIPEDVQVLAQGIIDFRTEWRVYILRDEILHVGRYRGDPLLFPDPKIMSEALKAMENRPIAFGMDWGVTATGETLLVEVNDGYSLGNYGIQGPEYTAMIEARWRELMGLPDNGVGRTLYEQH